MSDLSLYRHPTSQSTHRFVYSLYPRQTGQGFSKAKKKKKKLVMVISDSSLYFACSKLQWFGLKKKKVLACFPCPPLFWCVPSYFPYAIFSKLTHILNLNEF